VLSGTKELGKFRKRNSSVAKKDVPIRSAIIKSIPPNKNWNIIKYRRVTGPFGD